MELFQPTNTPEQNNNFPNNSDTRLLAAIVLISVIFGVFGGVVGALHFAKQPRFQRMFGSTSGGSPISVQGNYTEQSEVIDVVKQASPAVVSVVISKDLSRLPGFGSSPFDDPFFAPFFNRRPNQTTPNVQQVGAGSGFFISPDGLILTNKHVVEDEQASYTVITQDGKSYEGRVLARDPVNDLALMKVEISNAPYLSLADSSQIQIGQQVVAIGNSLGQYQNTVTTGVVSGIGRSVTAGGAGGSEQLEGVIQTDAAINPGNSGGPLLNLAGQVIGINTAIALGGQLVGFALPSNDAARAVESFQQNGRITRPFMGIRYVMITPALAEQRDLPHDYGALLIPGDSSGEPAVLPGSPAQRAGLGENDIILELNGKRLEPSSALSRELKNFKPGDEINLKVYQKGQERNIRLTLEEAR
jgi:serine protease Do